MGYNGLGQDLWKVRHGPLTSFSPISLPSNVKCYLKNTSIFVSFHPETRRVTAGEQPSILTQVLTCFGVPQGACLQFDAGYMALIPHNHGGMSSEGTRRRLPWSLLGLVCCLAMSHQAEGVFQIPLKASRSQGPC